jgi:SAM-dependent methyltransferase
MVAGQATLDLSAIVPACAGAQVFFNVDGTVAFTAEPVPGAYGAISPVLRDWFEASQQTPSYPIVLRVEAQARVDTIGVSVVSADTLSLLSGERRLTSGDGRTSVEIYVDEAVSHGRLLLRNYGTSEQSPEGQVFLVSVLPAASLSRRDLKLLRSREFSLWYYDMDLGDGVQIKAGLPDMPIDMAPRYKGRRILLWLLERYFGKVRGKRIVEPGSSSGFHTVELARRGARVTAYDTDDIGLRQARLIAECLASEFEHQPQFLLGDIYEFKTAEPFDISYCSGLIYHLPDVPWSVKLLAESCKQGVVLQTYVSDLEGELLEMGNADKYPFSIPRSEFAFVPSRAVLPRIFEWAGFREWHIFDASEFHSSGDEPDVRYTPGIRPGYEPSVYAALLK